MHELPRICMQKSNFVDSFEFIFLLNEDEGRIRGKQQLGTGLTLIGSRAVTRISAPHTNPASSKVAIFFKSGEIVIVRLESVRIRQFSSVLLRPPEEKGGTKDAGLLKFTRDCQGDGRFSCASTTAQPHNGFGSITTNPFPYVLLELHSGEAGRGIFVICVRRCSFSNGDTFQFRSLVSTNNDISLSTLAIASTLLASPPHLCFHMATSADESQTVCVPSYCPNSYPPYQELNEPGRLRRIVV
ncbi:hypothetical protein V2G26_019409 [Clonostachys chloroleuca]